jgi:ribosomal RNA-processing protein 8
MGKNKNKNKAKGAKNAEKVGKHNKSSMKTAALFNHKKVSHVPQTQKSSGLSSGGKGLSALQQKFARKLEGSRFRIINEKLYTTQGNEAFADFQSNPSLFDVYHEGFREQASHWPINPLHTIIEWIQKKHKQAVIADMGCGDAELALKVNNRVHSYDLVSKNSRVTACDIAHVPLQDGSVDIVVFCLSLMGTNIVDFLLEARRILKTNGIIRIAEVRSRFEGESDGIKKFMRVLHKLGFDVSGKGNANNNGNNSTGKGNDRNMMFFEVEALKTSRQPIVERGYSAKACIYKKR